MPKNTQESMRCAVIDINKGTGFAATYIFTVDNLIADSKFLHLILCELYPGSEYSVRFTDKRPRETRKTQFYYGAS